MLPIQGQRHGDNILFCGKTKILKQYFSIFSKREFLLRSLMWDSNQIKFSECQNILRDTTTSFIQGIGDL